jgi:tetratricopeptide (TPR) repeat protein
MIVPRRWMMSPARFCFHEFMRVLITLGCFALGVFANAASSLPSATDGVIRFLEERVKRDPDDFIAAEKLGNTYLQHARERGVIDSYAKAEASFRSVLKWTPESYPLRVSLASALVSQHKFREAAALAGKLTSASPNEAPAYAVLGDALLEIGDAPGAAAAYEKLLELAPGISAYTRIAKLKWLQGDVPAGMTNLILALQFSNSAPESVAWAHVQLGEMFFRMGRFSEAEREYDTALKVFPDYFLAFDHIAELRAAHGDFEEAIKLFEQLAKRTGRPEYLQAAGDIFVAARKETEAKLFHDRALAAYLKETDAGRVHYFHHLASFYADVREEGAEAEKWARRDLELRQNIYAWDALAWALYWKKDYAAAAEAMKKALALGTKDAHLLAHAGSIFVRAGKIQEGREFMKRAAEVNPHFQDFHVHR